MNSLTKAFLMGALAFACIVCRKNDTLLNNGIPGPVSVRVKFAGPEFVIKPQDPEELRAAKEIMEPLMFRELHIDLAFKSPKGALCVQDNSVESRDTIFCKQDFVAEELRHMSWQQMESLFGLSLTALRRDGVSKWQVCNGRSGEALRLFQIVGQFKRGGEITFLAINTGQPMQ